MKSPIEINPVFNNNNSANATQNNPVSVSQENNQSMHIEISQQVQTLIKIKNQAEELAYELKRLRRRNELPANITETDVAEVENDIAEIGRLVERFSAQRETNEEAAIERESLLVRIKRLGANMMNVIRPVDTLANLANNMSELLNQLPI